MRARKIGIDGERALKRCLCEIEIRGRLMLEFVQKSCTSSEPRPSRCECRISSNAHREQIARPPHRVERFEFGELLRAQKCRVGGWVDAGFADDRNPESVTELRNSLERV